MRDLESAQHLLTDGLGFRAGSITESHDVRSAFLVGENTKIELIQPVGPGPYWEFLEKGLVGLNHMALEVDDFTFTAEQLGKVGVKLQASTLGVILNLDPNTTAGLRIQLLKTR